LACGLALGYFAVESTAAITPRALCSALAKAPSLWRIAATNVLAAAVLGATATVLTALPLLLLFGYGVRVGAQVASAHAHGVPLIVSAGILSPHGVFELTGFVLAVALGAAFRGDTTSGRRWRGRATVVVALLVAGAAVEITGSRWLGAYLMRRMNTFPCWP
jgi:uncharacterized membrane protein SpoIIM required for sporulation